MIFDNFKALDRRYVKHYAQRSVAIIFGGYYMSQWEGKYYVSRKSLCAGSRFKLEDISTHHYWDECSYRATCRSIII
jgi:hypothetical protein